jgi:hypothetical protein
VAFFQKPADNKELLKVICTTLASRPEGSPQSF